MFAYQLKRDKTVKTRVVFLYSVNSPAHERLYQVYNSTGDKTEDEEKLPICGRSID